jgi:DNA-binding beta-propeller fold protein YncE
MRISKLLGATLIALSAPLAVAAGQGERLALVASEAENIVAVIDLETGQRVKTLSTGKTPHAMAITPSGRIYVNNRGTKDLTVIDGKTLEVAKQVALPATSFQLAVSLDGKTLAVAYKDALKLSLLDTASDTITKTVEIGNVPADFKGVTMKHPYWTPDGKHIYVADAVNRVIVKVDAAQGKVAGTIDIKGVNHYLHPSADGKLLYAVNEKSGGGTSLALIDPTTATIIKDLPVSLAEGEKPLGHHGTFTQDGRFFLVCNEGGSRVHVLDVQKQEWVKTIPTGNGPGHATLSPDGKHFFVVHHNDGVITVIDAGKMEAVKNISIGAGTKQAHSAWFSPDGRYYYAVASEDKLLAKIDVAKLDVVATMPVGAASMFFAIKDGGKFPPTE